MARGWGRAFRSRRTRTARLFLRGVRYSLLLFMSYEGLLDWYIRPGSINKESLPEGCGDDPGTPRCTAAAPVHSESRASLPSQVPIIKPFPRRCSVMVGDNFSTD